MTYVLFVLIALLLLDAVRMRGRAGGLHVLAPTDDPASAEHRIIAAPGVIVDPATLRAASAWAAKEQLAVVDLVPRDLPAIRAMSLLQLVDPKTYRGDRLGAGRTAGHALLVTADVAKRAELAEPADEVELVRLAIRLKYFGRADVAVAPAEHAAAAPADRFEILKAILGPSTAIALAVLPAMWLLIGLGIWSNPLVGLIALGVWQLQPLIALAGTPLRSRDLLVVTVLRLPIELAILVLTLARRRAPTAAQARRAEYAKLLTEGTARFLEPRRETCPLCESRELAVHLRNRDLMQHKPGRFTLERCGGCGHVFQNPRLSLAGLDFYYKDFYDGLGEAGMEFVFGYGAEPYHARARMMSAITAPKRWLDVGAGHGHFCVAALAELPATQFDGLDFSESIEEAERRGWVSQGYRGMFPDLAPSFAGRYDAVSMSHYLEHTLDPRKELAAAHVALAPEGYLMIEVPDPEFALGKLLGRYWLPWFQPQHQHLISVANLERLLREHGFDPITWHRGAAHQKVDFFFAAWLVLDRLAPPPRLPWRWRGRVAGAWRLFAWTLGMPLILGGIAIDNALGPLFQRAKVSNTYRVIARRVA